LTQKGREFVDNIVKANGGIQRPFSTWFFLCRMVMQMTMMLACYLNLSIFSSMEFLLVVLLVLELFLFLFSDWASESEILRTALMDYAKELGLVKEKVCGAIRF